MRSNVWVWQKFVPAKDPVVTTRCYRPRSGSGVESIAFLVSGADRYGDDDEEQWELIGAAIRPHGLWTVWYDRHPPAAYLPLREGKSLEERWLEEFCLRFGNERVREGDRE